MKNFMVGCWSVVVLLLVICVFNSWFVVEPGYNGFTVTLGKVNSTVYMDGLHFKTPFITKSVKYNIQTQKLDSFMPPITLEHRELQEEKDGLKFYKYTK